MSNPLKFITIPPVFAIATIMLARAMGSGQVVGEIDVAVWGLIWLLFIIISILYGMFIVNGFNVGLVPLQALAQGIILCPMAIVYGAKMFQWLGVIIAVCGAAALVVIYNQIEAEHNKVVVVESENDVKQLPLNFVITDDTGAILNLTEDMLKVFDLDRINTIGKNISDWFSPVSKTAEINEKIWDVKRKGFDNGKRFYFELNPKGLPTETEEQTPEEGQAGTMPLQFIDPDTQLHNFRYGMMRISDELYRAGRYNHPVSAVMIRIVFPQLLPDDDMEKYVRPFRAYCARLMKDLRQSDTAIQTGEFQILVVLSECQYQVVENITERLTGIVNALCPTFEEFFHVTVLNVFECFDGGGNLPTANELVDNLTHSMTRKYSAQALSE
ncbi:MAG: hypothetical protein IJM82_06250 [Synergistaceae bacterium]|nr:hypothetical protein [Synergistaceae bacterium]MBQ7068749.1 hypothetical protein [Synergistaceae bacterium]MBR0080050.1 hypothetical protein [Synergistaceae bacterium]MBR0234060.1 hypothetical protein [Synergistaceae bacterium]